METFDARKTQALYMILAGETYTFIAKTIKVCPKTIRRWLDEPEFAAEIKKESEALGTLARAQGLALSSYNVDTGFKGARFLEHVLNADGAALTVRMRAASQL